MGLYSIEDLVASFCGVDSFSDFLCSKFRKECAKGINHQYIKMVVPGENSTKQ